MTPLVDRAALLDRFDEDLEFLAETVELLESDGQQLLEELRAASAAGDRDTLARKAHALKGMISNFCAESVTREILAIELDAREGALDDVPQKLERFASSFESLCGEVSGIASGEPA